VLTTQKDLRDVSDTELHLLLDLEDPDQDQDPCLGDVGHSFLDDGSLMSLILVTYLSDKR